MSLKILTIISLFVFHFNSISFANEKECLTIGVNNLPPFAIIEENGNLRGIHVDYLRLLEKRSGHCFHVKSVPFARLIYHMKRGDYDGAVFFKSKSRASFAKPLVLILAGPFHTILPKKGLVLTTLEDLKGKIVGTLSKGSIVKKIAKIPGIQMYKSDSYNMMLKMLAKGRTDAVAGNIMMITWELKDPAIAKEVDIKDALDFGHKEQWLHFSLKSINQDKAAILKKATEDLIKDGSFKKILDQYLGKNWKNDLAFD